MTNPLKAWIVKSREEQRHAREMYLADYPELVCDDTHVMMSQATFDKIKRNCGTYDGTLPTGQFCGKMFLRHGELWWIGISKDKPMTHICWKSRKILILPSEEL